MNTQEQTWSGKADTSIPLEATSGGASSRANERRQSRTVISNARGCFIEVFHRESDPSIWIVKRSEKTFLFKKRISSGWFINKRQAFAYALEMKKEHEKHDGIDDVKKKYPRNQ